MKNFYIILCWLSSVCSLNGKVIKVPLCLMIEMWEIVVDNKEKW